MDNTNIILKIEECCNNIYKATNNQTVQEMNLILSNFISFKNFELLKILLYQSSSKNAKFYAANALTNLITENYLSVEFSDKLEMYQNLINFIQTNSEDLYLNSRYLLNILITLLCRIVRISWLQNEKFKEIIDDVLKTVKEENSFSMIIPFLIYTELIYQFQLPNLPPKNKLYRYISDFKEYALLPIYENATHFLINIFKQDIKFEKIEHCILFINELSKCINECMEYEEDLNIKIDNYKKFEIKPIYVPNNKKRSKDKTLNIDSLNLICRSLFDTHNIIAKLIKDYNLRTDQCLCLLQKYCSIKIIYLGDYKILFLKNIQNGIINLIHSKMGLDNDKNLEEFCKLIFLMKKNFTVMELLENINFIEQIFKFTLECIQYYPASISGLIYLIRFFGYFSSILAAHPIPSKEEIKNLINELVSILMKKIFSLFDQESDTDSFEDLQQQNSNLFLDLVDVIALISRGIFNNVNIYFLEFFNNILLTLKTPNNLNLNLVIKINYLLYFSTAVISFNQRVLLEKDFINKVMDQEDHTRIEVNDIKVDDISIYDNDLENVNEIQIISEILTRIFQIMEFYINTIKMINVNPKSESNMNTNIIIKMESGLFYFTKIFCKLFLSKKLSQKYSNIFNNLSETLNLKDNSMILNFIISYLVEICKVNQLTRNDHFLYQKVTKIFKIIVNNAYLSIDFLTGEKLLYIGKLLIQENFLNSVLEMPEILVKLDPLSFGKYRTIFYESINSIILMKTSPHNDDMFKCIIKFYTDNIYMRKDMLIGNEKVGYDILGYMKDLKGICSSISVKEDYNKFIIGIFQSLLVLQQFYKENYYIVEVNISYLRLFEETMNNKLERIYFPQNSTLPMEMLKLANEILLQYKNYLNTHHIQTDSQEEYLKRIKPIVLIVKIFKNIFIGKFIHFGSLISMNIKYFQEILYSLCDLIFSIKLENILNYLSKTNVFYYVLKVVFCEYANYINPNFYKFGDSLIKLIEEGIDSLDNVVVISTHQIIYEIGKLYLKCKNKQSLSNNPGYTDNNNPEVITYLFNKYEENFQNMLKKMFHSLLNGEITSLNEMSNSFFVLVVIYNTFYLNLSNNIILIQFGQDPNKQNKVRCAFDHLFKDVKCSFDSYNLKNFQKGLKEFANEIQTIMSYS